MKAAMPPSFLPSPHTKKQRVGTDNIKKSASFPKLSSENLHHHPELSSENLHLPPKYPPKICIIPENNLWKSA